jgi:translocation and assembly module TamB
VSVRRLLLALGVLALLPAWLLASESGLRFGIHCAERLSGGAVRVREVHGRLLGDVQLLGMEVATAASTVAIEQADLNLRLSRLWIGRVQAERLVVRQLSVTVHERPAAPESPLTVRAPLRLAVEDGEVAGFRLRLAGGHEWTLPEARFAGRWRGDWIVLARVRALTREAGPVQLRGRLSIADDLLQFDDFEVTQPSPVRIEGVLALRAGEESALKLTWERLRWPGGAHLPWLHSPQGTLAVEGPWRRYAWKLDADAVAADIPAQVVARGHGDLQSLALEDVLARALGGAVRGHGAVAWSPAVTTDLDLSWQALDPARRFAEWPGQLNGAATLHARWSGAPRVEFDARLDSSQLRGYPLALEARGTTEGEAVRLHELSARSGTSEVRAAGGLWPRLGLKGSLRSADFGSLWAGLSGQGEAQFSVAGTPATLRFGVRATARAPGYGAVRARALALDADVGYRGHSRATLTVDGLEAGVALERLVLAGAGTREEHQASLTLAGAEGNAVMEFAGGERAGTWRGHLTDATLSPAGDATPWRLEEPAALTASLGGLRLEPACLGGAGSRACADLDLGADAQRIAFRIHELALAHLKPWLPADWTVTGQLNGSAAVQLRGGELTAIRADLAGTAGAIDGDGVRLEYGPGALRVQPDDTGRLHAVLDLAPAGGVVHGEVWVSAGGALLDRPMLGDLRMKLPDLAWLPVISPEIASAQGSIDAELSVAGTPRSPSLSGRMQVADGRVRLATPGIELTEISASFDRGRSAPLNAHFSARSGEGRFTLDGVLRTMQPRLTGEFKLKGEQVLGVNTPELRAWVTPDFTLALDGTRARLTGELLVPRAEITPRQIRGGGIAPSSDQVVVSADEAVQGNALQVESQVRIVLGDKVRFDGLGLKTRLEGAITADDEVGRPTTGRGELRLVGGRYRAYGQDLVIETGRLLFNGGPITDPAIDLSAFRELPSTQAREVSKVGLRARGTLEAPEFSLYSEPAMSQEEQLSWLVLGRSLDASLKADQAGELDSAATSLGLTGGDLLAQRLAPRLGLDEVSVGARPGETADLARLTIGKYLSPKLFLSYGVGLFQPGHFFRLQYDLSRRFKLQGESGLNQGGDVLYSVETGGDKK